MSRWPLLLRLPDGELCVPQAGWYALAVEADELVIDGTVDDVLHAAQAVLGTGSVGWMPEGGGLLSNLPAWENLLLSTQWHVPASHSALESRLRGWCERLGYDKTATEALLSRQPVMLDDDERTLVGWLRQMLCRPRLVVLRARALPSAVEGGALRALIAEELAGSALLVVDEYVPAGFEALVVGKNGEGNP